MEALPTYYFPWDPLTPSLSGSINLWLYVSLQVHRLSWFCTCQLLEHHAGWGRANCLFTSRSSVSRPCLAVSGCCLVPEEWAKGTPFFVSPNTWLLPPPALPLPFFPSRRCSWSKNPSHLYTSAFNLWCRHPENRRCSVGIGRMSEGVKEWMSERMHKV